MAPQANAMAAVIKPLMEGGATPWMLYFAGCRTRIDSDHDRGTCPWHFAWNVYSVGSEYAFIESEAGRLYVSTRSKDEKVNKMRRERGTLIASGFIAGGALMGVISAVLKYAGADWYATWSGAEWLAVVMYVVIIGYFIWDSLRAKEE